MSEDHKDAQQEPAQDSGLQTPQPDQPHPPVSDVVQPDEDSPPVHVEVDTSEPVEVNVDNPAAPAEGSD
jgi:hypothetical protein